MTYLLIYEIIVDIVLELIRFNIAKDMLKIARPVPDHLAAFHAVFVHLVATRLVVT